MRCHTQQTLTHFHHSIITHTAQKLLYFFNSSSSGSFFFGFSTFFFFFHLAQGSGSVQKRWQRVYQTLGHSDTARCTTKLLLPIDWVNESCISYHIKKKKKTDTNTVLSSLFVVQRNWFHMTGWGELKKTLQINSGESACFSSQHSNI